MSTMFRLQENVPQVYVDESRDFQILCRLFDYCVNGIASGAEAIPHAINPEYCDSKLLPLLAQRIGFISDAQIDARNLRFIIKSFPTVIRNKGSLLGIQQALNAFLKANLIDANTDITISNEEYTLTIGIESTKIVDTTPLKEVLRYILPAGYMVNIGFYQPISEQTGIVYSDMNGSNITVISDKDNSIIDSTDTNNIEGNTHVLRAVDTIETLSTEQGKNLSTRYVDFNNNSISEEWVFQSGTNLQINGAYSTTQTQDNLTVD